MDAKQHYLEHSLELILSLHKNKFLNQPNLIQIQKWHRKFDFIKKLNLEHCEKLYHLKTPLNHQKLMHHYYPTSQQILNSLLYLIYLFVASLQLLSHHIQKQIQFHIKFDPETND